MKLGGHELLKHHFYRARFTELNEIFWFMSLRAFALSLVNIFILIYLYKLGYHLREIFFYDAIIYIAELLFEYPSVLFLKKIGPKHLIAISIPILIIHLAMLLSLPSFRWPLYLIAIIGGISLSFFWQPYHYDFSRSKHHNRASSEVGRIIILLTLVGAIAPLIGGIIADVFGIWVVFIIVISLLILASFVLFKTKDRNYLKGKLDFKKLEFSKIKKDIIAYCGAGIEGTVAVSFWGLFLFLIIDNYTGIGILTSLSLLTGVLITYYVSKKSDQGYRYRYLKAGSVMLGFTNGIRIFVSTVIHALGVDIARSIASSFFSAPFVSEYYLHADEEARSEYIFIMETSIDVARIIFFSLSVFLTYFFADKIVLIIGLVIGSLGSFAVLLMPPADCDICGPMKNKKLKLVPTPARRQNA